ncbi:F-box/FBD/LRR-repeat protein At1g13570-like isoform X2 [Ipomoea triloba]|uniref:F-box/FBD/LRR-repeat protein At1g13570-like isoform X2 n=1 Tax=Ipomoea triloba TaxID=35885 RepID=UPI00125CF4EC|nr:F-box/FBD/LRR-repeat protein At1g13570-like isoform X2 [Ipomoea triloba]
MLFSAESLAVYRFHSGRSIELERFSSSRFRLQKYGGYKRMVNILDRVIIHRAAPVKKFTLSNSQSDLMLNQCDLDRWCLFLSRNGVEELSIALVVSGQKYDVPIWVLSCPTIRHLNLEGFLIGCPRNAPCIFPGVTLLRFKNVEFKRSANGIVSCIIPNLEKLALSGSCGGINTFEISSPKLESFSAIDVVYVFESRWLKFHLKAIKTLCLSGLLLSRKPVAAAVPTFPTALNLQVMKLYELSFGCGKQLTVAMQLIKKCPNLCELGIMAEKSSWRDDKEAASRLRVLEDPDGCFNIQDLTKLNTIKFECHSGSTLEMLFLKTLLSKSPQLEKVFIQKGSTMECDISRELLCFPHASPKAQLVFKEVWLPHTLIGHPELYEFSLSTRW